MSFRASEGAQWSDKGAATTKRHLPIVLDANDDYTLGNPGDTADAILVLDANSDYVIAASGTEAARFIQIGTTGPIYIVPV
jgi:hypothetical protein